ncbi:MAG: abortive infection family protein [Candidatus Melainabacteria bacterium]|nr:abortive infection family protein [Candidatus Melainabacteria bacterium]
MQLGYADKIIVERFLGMGSGYVLNFSDRTFDDFIGSVLNIEIHSDKYSARGSSKANKLRTLFELESPHAVATLLFAFMDYVKNVMSVEDPDSDKIAKIATKLRDSAHSVNMDALVPNAPGWEFESLSQSVKEAISRGEPQAALDRLHTFMVKFLRELCKAHDIDPADKPLHSVFGEYIRFLRENNLIESRMTGAILKACNSTMEAFNDVRNNQSLAHDNNVLNQQEAYFIASHVAALVQFLRSVEKIEAPQATIQSVSIN